MKAVGSSCLYWSRLGIGPKHGFFFVENLLNKIERIIIERIILLYYEY